MLGPVTGDDGLARCPWGAASEVYRAYHDDEWGRPVHGESAYLERLTLEAFQSGLSWLTILNKREAFRAAFAGFDADRVAAFDDGDRARLMADAGIVRNRLKIDAAIANAATILELRRSHGSFAAWLDAHHPRSKDEWVRLFKRTFRFTGGEIVGEFLMSIGYLPGAHAGDCPVYRKVMMSKPMWARATGRA